jgi:hypothetical protein
MVVPESHTKLSHNAKLILETKKFAPKEMFFPSLFLTVRRELLSISGERRLESVIRGGGLITYQ